MLKIGRAEPRMWLYYKDIKSYPTYQRYTISPKDGIITELVSAKNTRSIFNYIEGKGFSISKKEIREEIEKLAKSVNTNSTYLIVWIPELNNFLSSESPFSLQIFFKFKSDRLVIPYSIDASDAYLYVRGFPSYNFVDPFTVWHVDYVLKKGRYNIPKEFIPFYGKEYIDNMEITLINMSKESFPKKHLKENKFLQYLNIPFLKLGMYVIYIICFILVSCILSLLTGLITVPKKIRPNWMKLFGVGIFNSFTLIGFVVAVGRLIDRQIEKLESKGKEENEYLEGHIVKWRYSCLFSFLFFIVTIYVFVSLMNIFLLNYMNVYIFK